MPQSNSFPLLLVHTPGPSCQQTQLDHLHHCMPEGMIFTRHWQAQSLTTGSSSSSSSSPACYARMPACSDAADAGVPKRLTKLQGTARNSPHAASPPGTWIAAPQAPEAAWQAPVHGQGPQSAGRCLKLGRAHSHFLAGWQGECCKHGGFAHNLGAWYADLRHGLKKQDKLSKVARATMQHTHGLVNAAHTWAGCRGDMAQHGCWAMRKASSTRTTANACPVSLCMY